MTALCARLPRGPPNSEQTLATNSKRRYFPGNNSGPNPQVCRVSVRALRESVQNRARLQEGEWRVTGPRETGEHPPLFQQRIGLLTVSVGYGNVRSHREAGVRPAPTVLSDLFQSTYHK